MIGAIIGDIIAHPYESWLLKANDKNINLFMSCCKITDDSVLTIAIADSILNATPYHESLKKYALKYPNAGYGSSFMEWAEAKELYVNDSWSNGCAMRISPIAYAFDTLDEIKDEVQKSIAYTHNHPDSFNGAYAIAMAIFMARNNKSKLEIKDAIEKSIGYNLNFNIIDIKRWPKNTIKCDVTVPQALICFLESTSYEDCLRNAIYSEGDCDTIAAMSGGIAEAFYKEIPDNIIKFAKQRIPPEFLDVISKFNEKYPLLNYNKLI